MECGKTAWLKPETVALRPPLAGAQRRYRGRRDRPRRPACDGPGALPRLLVVDDAGEPAAHLDGGRQLALLLIDGADRGGIGFGDDEHGGVDGRGRCAGQALSGKRKGRSKTARTLAARIASAEAILMDSRAAAPHGAALAAEGIVEANLLDRARPQCGADGTVASLGVREPEGYFGVCSLT